MFDEKEYEAIVVDITNTKKHPDADLLDIVSVFGYDVIINRNDWAGETKAVYITPDTILSDGTLIRAKKIRGVYSEGMLLKAPDDSNIGDNLFEALGLKHYEPVQEELSPDDVYAPKSNPPIYGIANSKNASNKTWKIGETLIATEKIHGENWRATIDSDGTLFVGSRTRWKSSTSHFHEGVTENITRCLKENPGITIYGELSGKVTGFPYGFKGKRTVVVFDVLKDKKFMNFEDVVSLMREYEIPTVPVVAEKEWAGELSDFLEFAEGKSLLDPSHIREGVVLRTNKESDTGMRKVLKLVGKGYLAKQNKKG